MAQPATRIIHARLDAESVLALDDLLCALGWSESKIIRQALVQLARQHKGKGKRIVGLGKFKSGLSDLGSNKDHLRDFGK